MSLLNALDLCHQAGTLVRVRKTTEFITGVATATAVAVGVSGCGSEVPASPKMIYEYQAEDVDPKLMEAQIYLGEKAVGIISSEAIGLRAFGIEYQTKLGVPANEAARSQYITFVPDLPDSHGFGTGITDYGVKQNEAGVIERVGESRSRISQRGGDLGPISSIVLHFCLSLEQESTPPVTNEDAYRGIQTAVCTSAGEAAQYSIDGKTYADYVTAIDRVAGSSTVRPPVLSQRQFNAFDVRRG